MGSILSLNSEQIFQLRAQEDREQKFRALVEQSITGIFIIEEDIIVYANPRFAEIHGYLQEDIIGMSIYELIPEDQHEFIRTVLSQSYSGEKSTHRFDGKLIRQDGTLIDYGAHCNVIVHQGKPAILGTIQDISEQKRAQELERKYINRLVTVTRGSVDAVAKMIELRDPYTAGHEHRVGRLAADIGAEIGLSHIELTGLTVIGGLHDIGKISVPIDFLTKPSKLSYAEYEVIKTHPQNGFDVLKAIDFPWPVAESVLQHHERVDGSGYPNGLAGAEINIYARIIAIADTVEAMASSRPYRKSLGLEDALNEIESNIGKKYDAEASFACLKLFREKAYCLNA